MEKDLGKDSIFKLLVELSIPAILSMIVAAVYNLVDRIFIGRVNPLGLAAVGVTMPVQIVQMAFVLLIGIGGSTLISIKLGEKDIESAEKLLFNSLVFIVITEILATVLCIIFINPILDILAVNKSIYRLSKDYIVIILLGGMPGLTGYCLNNTVRSIGFAKNSMKIVTYSSLLNIALDALFILVFRWGVKGAAIATVISQTWVTYMVFSFFIRNRKTPVKLHFKWSMLDRSSIRDIISNGLPSFYMQVFGTFVSVILNRVIIKYGGNYNLASVTIISSVSLMLTMVIYGISQGAQPIIGYNFGAKNYERCLKVTKIAVVAILVITSLFLLFIEIYPGIFIGLFTKEKSLYELTLKNIKIYLLGIQFIGLHSIATTFFQSVRKPRYSSLLYIMRYGIVLIPLLYILPKINGITGVYMSNAINDIVSGSVAVILLFTSERKMRKECGYKALQ